MLKYIVEKGADNNVKDINNRTDFHNYAIMVMIKW